MKRKILCLLFMLTNLLLSNAQQKKDWGEINFAFGNRVIFLSSDLQTQNTINYIPQIITGAEVRIYNEIVVFGELQIDLKKGYGLKQNINMFGELDTHNKYQALSQYKSNGWHDVIEVRNVVGAGYRTYVKGWRFTPMLGIGLTFGEDDTADHYTFFKQIGTNNIYGVDYTLTDDEVPYFLQFKLKASKKINRRLSLNFAFEYDLYLTKIRLDGRFYDAYSPQTMSEISIARRPHALNLSVGLGFR